MGGRVLVVLLAHNEKECIAATVAELRSRSQEVDILVVDDGSLDGTSDEAATAGAAVIRHPFNLGVAIGEATGLLYAQRNGYQRVVRMDGDGQHDPDSLPDLLHALDGGAELVIGSRFAGMTSFRSSWIRRVGNRFLSGLLSSLCGQRITDPTSGYRGFSGRAVTFFARIQPNDYPEPESLLMASRQGFKISEVPVRMRQRRTGVSSLTMIRSAYYMLKVSFALLIERLRTV